MYHGTYVGVKPRARISVLRLRLIELRVVSGVSLVRNPAVLHEHSLAGRLRASFPAAEAAGPRRAFGSPLAAKLVRAGRAAGRRCPPLAPCRNLVPAKNAESCHKAFAKKVSVPGRRWRGWRISEPISETCCTCLDSGLSVSSVKVVHHTRTARLVENPAAQSRQRKV